MKSSDIRKSFIEYFQKQAHTYVPSSPVVPQNDPTLLFTNAGMNQFKPFFLGNEQPPYKRAVNSQKCIRVSGKHNDLEEVGRDDYHHTFFEMLGNWSFGDYYKPEAIEWAWNLFTKEWGLDPKRLYATVYKDDNEAFDLWKKISGLPESRIMRFGEKDNFWEMGETGPCGPCSEIHYYKGNDPDHQDPSRVNAEDALYIELWNLVFIQYKRDEKGILTPLPSKHVDTGAGFERLAAVLNGVQSNYETDVFIPLIHQIANLSGRDYSSDLNGMPHRVIADHIRMLSVAIADGALPGNEGRGYVLRRILRRASRYGRQLDMHRPFMKDLLPVLIQTMGNVYPELNDHSDHIRRVLTAEEESFGQTLDRGLEIFETVSAKTIEKREPKIPDADVFKLYDTFGFPMDLTRLLAEEKGLVIDEKGFEILMNEQREKARSVGKFRITHQNELTWKEIAPLQEIQFTGYDAMKSSARLLRIAVRDDLSYCVFDATPFYAESGGQTGDKGLVRCGSESWPVTDTQKIEGYATLIVDGFIPEDLMKENFILEITVSERRDTARNHTATHLLHASLRQVLGLHVHQAGSYVGPEHLRFDFTHFEKIGDEDLLKIQTLVNENIMENIPLNIRIQDYNDAVNDGAMALFGEKYSSEVRTIQIGNYSYELCGGTHVNATGDIGYFQIVSESSVAAGVRRIEAITGHRSLKLQTEKGAVVHSLSQLLQTQPTDLTRRIQQLQDELKQAEKEVKELKQQLLQSSADDYLKNAVTVHGIPVFVNDVIVDDMDQLKSLGDKVREKLHDSVALFIATINDNPQVLCVVPDELVKSGIHAGKWVGMIGKALGGGGGGRPHMATAGGRDQSKVKEVFSSLETIIKV